MSGYLKGYPTYDLMCYTMKYIRLFLRKTYDTNKGPAEGKLKTDADNTGEGKADSFGEYNGNQSILQKAGNILTDGVGITASCRWQEQNSGTFT